MTAQGPTPPNAPPSPAAPSPPGAAQPPKARGWRTPIILLPLTVAALSLLLAFVSLLVAWRAVSVANDAKDTVAGGQPADTSAAEPDALATTREAPPQDQPPLDPAATGAPPDLGERTDYDVEYEKRPLLLEATDDTPMYVDVDTPAADVKPDGAELSLLEDYQGNQFIQLRDDVRGSALGAAGMTPKDCYEKITSAPMGGERKVAPRQGDVLCVLTSFAAARVKNDDWRLVRVEITGVGADRKVAVELTAWNIPR